MTKFQYYLLTFKNTFKIFSRASFEEIISYFYLNVLLGLFWTITYIFIEMLEVSSLRIGFEWTTKLLIFINILVVTSLFIRRFHDIGKSSIYIFVPFYNIFLLFQEGEKKSNKYGEVPV